MLDIIMLFIGLIGFGIAGYLDLKTTEFPDIIPYAMLAAIIVLRLGFSFYSNDYSGLLGSIYTGMLFLTIGFSLYLLKQWGNGDAWLLGILGFLYPNSFFRLNSNMLPIIPVQVIMLFNFLVVGFFYMLVYYLALGLKNRQVVDSFLGRIRKRFGAKSVFLGIVLFGGYYSLVFYMSAISASFYSKLILYISIPALAVFYLLVIDYSKSVEKNLFKKEISVRELKIGDVLANSRYKGLRKKDLIRLRKKGGYVWVKEGVRFVPSFFITVLFLLVFGSLL